jgi:hypothetical protein
MDPNNDKNGTRLDAVSRLSRRAADIRAALKQVRARQRAQERTDRLRLEALIGSAVLLEIEASGVDVSGAHRAYISEALAKHAPEPSRGFLKAKGWL